MPKRRGRERVRHTPAAGCFTLRAGAFWVSVDLKTGKMWSDGGGTVPPRERDSYTRAVLAVRWKYGLDSPDPLAVRDFLFGEWPAVG